MKFTGRYIAMGGVLLITLLFQFQRISGSLKELHAVNGADLSCITFESETGALYPSAFYLSGEGRAPTVRKQGGLETCWAFASVSALESSLLPEKHEVFSANHMVRQNAFRASPSDGGDYTMAMAYLAGWQGPVLESEDPYETGGKPMGLSPQCHVQEIRILEEKDLAGIKEAIFLYGGVQTPIYNDLRNTKDTSPYYNEKTASYCYIGTNQPNHDVVMIGWDDNYPKESFAQMPPDNGAFLCQNSWGKEFGKEGCFYISYYDTNLGIHSIVYTDVEDADNFDHIYQTDNCGWVGQIGYGQDSAFGANIYRASQKEELSAVGFYATGKDSSYQVFFVPDFNGAGDFTKMTEIASGTLGNAGYYTARLDNPVSLSENEEYAVVLRIETPGSSRPLAVEYRADELTRNVSVSDGDGYISMNGRFWDDIEEIHQCNLCLKAYTKNID